MGKFTEVALSAKHKQLWSETRVAMQYCAPAFTHVFYSMMTKTSGDNLAVFTNDIERAATDGKVLLLNPEWFFKLPLMQRVFVVNHEIAHAIFDHCGQAYRFRKAGKVAYPDGKSLKFDDRQMNIAQDLVINDMLIQSKIGQFPPEGCHDPKTVTFKDSSVDAYRKIYDDQQGGGGGGSGSGFDQHLDPGASDGQNPADASNSRNADEWRVAVAAGAMAAKGQGKLPAAMELFIEQLLTPVVFWGDKIQAFFARKVGSGSYDWRRPDRRLVMRDIYAPGRSGFGAGTVVIAIDTSGSIICDKGLLDRFFSEAAGILEDVRPRRTVVLWIDAHVAAVDEVEEPNDLRALRPKGGGGTDFRPAFDWIAEQRIEPDCLVYLTDGDGSFPRQAPSYPTLWGNITPRYEEKHYPFGDVVTIPVSAAA